MDLLLGFVLSILAGFFPTVIYAWFVWWLDRYEKEPWWLLVAVFLWGMIGAPIITLILELLLDIPISLLGPGLAYELVGASFVAPVVEEITKAVGLLAIFFFFYREFDSVLDGIVYGAMAGLGFAFTENVIYFVGGLVESGWGGWVILIFMRAILFGLNHAFFTGLTGAGLVLFRLAHRPGVRLAGLFGGLILAIAFHALHNVGATLAGVNCFSLFISLGGYSGGLLMVAISIALVWRQERRWLVEYLQPEVGTLLTPAQFELIASPWQRFRLQSRLFFGDRATRQRGQLWRKLAQSGTELAFKRYQLARFSQDRHLQQEVEALYAQFRHLRQTLSQFEA